MAEAIRYSIRHWDDLILFAAGGCIEMGSNTVERAIMRPWPENGSKLVTA